MCDTTLFFQKGHNKKVRISPDLFDLSIFSPHHFVYYTGVGLNDLYNLCRYVLLDIIGHGNSVIPVFSHLNCSVNRLEKALLVNSGKHEACLVKCLGTLS